MDIGSVVLGTIERIVGFGTPVMSLPDGSTAFVIDNKDRRYRYHSNRLKDELVLKVERDGYHDQKSLIMITERCKDGYLAVCYAQTSSGMSALESHSVVISDIVSYAGMLDDFWVSGFGIRGEEKIGVIPRSDPWSPGKSGLAERIVMSNHVYGSKRHRFPGLRPNDRLLVREIGNNKSKNKDAITYFFEPAINLLESDGAYDMYTLESMVTRMVDHNGEEPERFAKGGYLFDLPVLYSNEIDTLGMVGVGYVKRPEYESKRNLDLFGMKKVWIRGGHGLVGKIARRADILYDKGVVIAEVGRGSFAIPYVQPMNKAA